jgi:hypothetical protein
MRRSGQAGPSYFRRCMGCVGHRTSNFVRVRATGLRWRPWLPQQSFASGESRIGVAWSIGRASRLTGRGAAGWKLRKSTCETRCGTGCNEGAPLELAAQLPSDAQRTQPRCGARRREAFQIRLPADGGASTATAALPEALDAQRVRVPRAERSRRCCSVSGQPLLHIQACRRRC